MALNEFSTSRLIIGFIFLVFGLEFIFHILPYRTVYLFEYEYVVGAVSILVGSWFTYRAFTKN